MPSKLKIKIGPIEVEYEGEETFLKQELPALLKAVHELYETSEGKEFTSGNGSDAEASSKTSLNGSLTTSLIAGKLGCHSGPDLATAAAYYLRVGAARESFSRDDIREQMRSAKSYFKKTYVSNLSASLKRLVSDGRLNEISPDVFGLPDGVRKELEGRLDH